ncbi:MAG: hypothetical protein EOP53_08865 [Sphingobacteriales bacterium]|nr:MAG: hypothetical protein EOP53_08865 [Sphingobacteriales bacterium]
MNVQSLNNPDYSNLGNEQLPRFGSNHSEHTVVFVVDSITFSHPDYPILCITLDEEYGKSFRVIPAEVSIVAANLFLANMDFFEFYDSTDPDGIFRGFK